MSEGGRRSSGKRAALMLQVAGGILLLAAAGNYTYGRFFGPTPPDPTANWSDEYKAVLARSEHWPLPQADLSEVEPRVRELIQSVTESVDGSRGAANSWFQLGATFHAHSLLPQAVECYGRVLELNRYTFAAQYLIAVATDQMGEERAEDALVAFDKAIELDPGHAQAYYRKGAILQRRGRLEEAKSAYRMATEKGRDFDMAYLALGRVLLDLGDADGALEALLKSAEIYPANAAVHASLARVYRSRGDAEAAAEREALAAQLEELRDIPDGLLSDVHSCAVSSTLVRARSRESLARGAFELARPDLELCLALTPDDGELLYDYGRCLRALGRDEEAAGALEKCLEQSTAPSPAGWQLGMIRIARGQEAEGRELIERALANWQVDSRFELDRAGALSSAGRDEDALAVIRALAKRSAPAHRLAAEILASLQRDGEAVIEMERALELQPRDNEFRNALIDKLEGLGRSEDAARQRELLFVPRSSLAE